jgi:hypothetical protein
VRLTRRGRLAVTLALVLLAGALATYAVRSSSLGTALGLGGGPDCVVESGDVRYEWSTAEAMTATTVAGVGTRIGATVNGVAAAVNRALAVDRERAVEPDAAREVYRRLPDVARPEADALLLAELLLGHRGGVLTCMVPVTDAVGLDREEAGELGLTPRADEVRVAMREVFGKQILGGFEPAGVDSGHVEGSAHYEGRAIDVFFRPISEANQRLGWQQAMWAVAHADDLAVATVIFDREIWSAQRSVQGWRTYRYPGGATDNPVLLHEDHVHVDVAVGG